MSLTNISSPYHLINNRKHYNHEKVYTPLLLKSLIDSGWPYVIFFSCLVVQKKLIFLFFMSCWTFVLLNVYQVTLCVICFLYSCKKSFIPWCVLPMLLNVQLMRRIWNSSQRNLEQRLWHLSQIHFLNYLEDCHLINRIIKIIIISAQHSQGIQISISPFRIYAPLPDTGKHYNNMDTPVRKWVNKQRCFFKILFKTDDKYALPALPMKFC